MSHALHYLEIKNVVGSGIQDSFYIDFEVGHNVNIRMLFSGNALHQMAKATQRPPKTVHDDYLSSAVSLEITNELPQIVTAELQMVKYEENHFLFVEDRNQLTTALLFSNPLAVDNLRNLLTNFRF